jgi:hypothetical protein
MATNEFTGHGVNTDADQETARTALLARYRSAAERANAPIPAVPLDSTYLDEMRRHDASFCSTKRSGSYSQASEHRRDLLRYLDAISQQPRSDSTPRAADACLACGCTDADPCEGADDPRVETTLEVVLCRACVCTIARDAVVADIYQPPPDDRLVVFCDTCRKTRNRATSNHAANDQRQHAEAAGAQLDLFAQLSAEGP